MKWIVLLAAFFVMAHCHRAEAEHPRCAEVRAFAEQHGYSQALALAIASGATKEQIAQAKECLKKKKVSDCLECWTQRDPMLNICVLR